MDQLDQIREKINIVDLLSESLTLKRAGRNFKALCPFHSEKTPSFVISPERQIWHCFGCGKGGNVFNYLMEMDRLEFSEALKILAARAGVKLQSRPGDSKKAQIRERLLEIHHLSEEFYHYLLTQHKLGQRAMQYLKNRGINDKLIKTFYLGFAPSSWNNLAKFLRKKNYTDYELETSGLVLRGRSGFYDRFRNRLMFPLKNYRGETIAFSGRVLDKDVKEAKYINSPETPIYVKGETLYGMNLTKDAIRKSNSAIIVEGEFDMISSFAAGVDNVVAIKGSALTEAQVSLLKRFTDRLILSLDRDSAGDAAARRGIEIADRAGMDIRVVDIPSGKDPDEAARENAQKWKEAVKNANSFYDFLINSAIKRFDKNDAYGKKKISDEVLPAIAKISNTIVQAHYLKKIAQVLGITEEKVGEAMKKIKTPFVSNKEIVNAKDQVKELTKDMLEEHLLSLILQSSDIKKAVEMTTEKIDPADLNSTVIRKIMIALIDEGMDKDKIIINELVSKLPQELVAVLDRAYLKDLSVFTDDEILQKELVKTIKATREMILRRKIREISTKITQAEAKNDEKRLESLKIEMGEITSTLKSIS